ncbi:phosphoenolpyruvate--protein phosphotransferase [Geoalkalibacter subterraneus]|uniref:phosphoenolpyruvate--protein phosphotransferase n=1 Tax=Geoalkalibacter subterraneus TaxID=483547 RepID=A0A0B5FNH8_9BACT|nr:phosphoenolpyruvate--protein phosphotransferase [Geoalkalibacter subterraneus]AJF06189.1 diguanylate phosphodiesterase [Geoalkalibacter subterraneus]
MTPHRKKAPFGITTLEDISTLILQSHDLDETLNNIVSLVARRMRTEVCSIYLLEDDHQSIRLRATKGLSRRAIGRVVMRIDEGLTGLAIENGRVISILEPNKHPRYRYFKETREERFHTFLGIPLFDRREPIGVITIQTVEPRQFSPEEISALSTIAFQVSSIVVNARLLDSIRRKEEESNRFARELEMTRKNLREQSREEPEEAGAEQEYRTLRGTVAYPGVSIGPANLLDERLGFADILDEEGIVPEKECEKLEGALEKTRIQTLYLEKRMADRFSADDAAIFHTHLMILEDRGFLKRLTGEIRDKQHSAPYALKKVVAEYIEGFSRMDDAYLRERAADMEDIGRRILANLVGQKTHHLHLKNPGILVAKELLPSDMATLDHTKIQGIVTEAGEKNSHAVIMAKSMGIPAIVGVKSALKLIHPDEPLILDANSGTLYISPSEQIKDEFERLEQDRIRETSRLEKYRDLPARTRDGVELTLRANIGLIGDMAIARRNGAVGVGLYRTEFPYMARSDFPDRNEQYHLYRRIIEGFGGDPVTIRTLDIGGDKALPYFTSPKEDNPFMGWRSVRVSLDHRDIFRTQIEAILMAGVHGPVKLLFPMISGMDELRGCRRIIKEASENLAREGIEFKEKVPVGVMIEVPSAVYLADRLAREVDFFALGTNDLIQYVLAADRNNPLVSKYYDPLHPAVLQVLKDIGQCAERNGIGLCICGEMATDPIHMTLLLGLGFREFSMAAPFIPRIKGFLGKISLADARKIAERALELEEGSLVREQIRRDLLTHGIKVS